MVIKDEVKSIDISTYPKYISNYNNVYPLNSPNIVYSPKNKRYTLSLGILNSLNEFQDITDTLYRWEIKNNKSQIIDTYSENPSDLYKFNRGYFIATRKPDGLGETIKDSELITKRQILPANTYAYKLVGPMYLKVDYNHINNFSYSITGLREDNGKYILQITGIVIYNCPDVDLPRNYDQNPNLSNYCTLEELESDSIVNDTLNGFDFFENRQGTALELDEENITKTIKSYRYDELNNQYVVEIIEKITNIEPNRDGHIFDYIIAAGEKNLYLRGLTEAGSIDLNLLGSGTTSIDNWKFSANFEKKELYLRFSFYAYPKIGQTYRNLKVTIGNNSQTYDTNLGTGTINMTFTNVTMLKLYIAEITYDIVNLDGSITPNQTYSDGITYWVLTTELFNDCFNTTDANPIKNYAKPVGKEIVIMLKKLTITPKFIVNKVDNSGETTSTISGQLLRTSSGNVEAFSKLSKNIDISITLTLDVDKKLYPDYLEWTNTFSGSLILFANPPSGFNSNASYLNNEIRNESKSINGDTNVFDSKQFVEIQNLRGQNGRLTGTLNWYDWFISGTNKFEGTIENAFDTVKNYITDIFNVSNKSKYISYTGFTVDATHDLGSNDNKHFIGLITNYPLEYYTKRSPVHGLEELYYTRLKGWTSDNDGDNESETNSNISLYEEGASGELHSIREALSNISDSVIFAYLIWDGDPKLIWLVDGTYKNNNNGSYINPDTWNNNPGISETPIDKKGKGRFMWKSSAGNWTFIDGFFPEKSIFDVSNSVMNLFLNLFNTPTDNILICRYSLYNGLNSNFYVADKYNGYKSQKYSNKLFMLRFKTQQINFVNDPSSDVLHFSGAIVSESNEIPVCNISSSLKFIDYINTFNEGNKLSNIDINTGIAIDSNGEPLNKNFTYVLKNNSLRIWSNSPIEMVGNQLDTEYSFRCKEDPYSGNSLLDRLQNKWIDYFAPASDSNDDAYTWLRYNIVHRISKDKFNYIG